MPAIGITGGISSGKSTFFECLRQILPQAKFFDADRAARDVIEQAEVRAELVREFGNEIFAAGNLNRAALRAIIFADAAKKEALEKILHPRIRRRWSAEAETHRQSPNFFFADIPLLYETNGQTLCDRVVVVACSPHVQLARLRARLEGPAALARPEHGEPGWPADFGGQHPFDKLRTNRARPSIAEQMILSQMPLQEKISRADHVVWNNGPPAALAEQAKLLIELWRQEKWTKA